jgi:hypothetical protein
MQEEDMASCEVCGNAYDKSVEVVAAGARGTCATGSSARFT